MWRKYGDFVWLRAFLTKRFVGMLIPSTPHKLSANATPELCEPARQLFGLFLERVGRSDYLRRDSGVAAFLSIVDDQVHIRI